MLESLAAQHGKRIVWIEGDPHAGPDPDQVAAAVGPDTALVTFSHVSYRSAYILDARAITAVAHQAGALALWDLSHSTGAIPVSLDADGVDLAVGCTYKYLNGGPGAPAYLYVSHRHQGELRQPIWGWLGRRDPFEMAAGYLPGEGIAGMLSGTPPVLALTAAAVGIDLVIEAGIDAIRAKSTALTEYAITLIDAWLAPLGAERGLAPGPGAARVPRRPRASRRPGAVGTADRRRGDRRLPHPGRDSPRPVTTHHPVHRRPRRGGPGA